MGTRRHISRIPVRRRKRAPLFSGILLSFLLSLSLGGVVYAYLSMTAGAIENHFEAAVPRDPSVSETFQNNVKSNVSIDVGNPGYSVYVRAAVLVNWKNAQNGEVLGNAPVPGKDYILTIGSDWNYRDGFYYCKTPISSGQTPVLIHTCYPLNKAPKEGYALNVEILTQTIQAQGKTDDDSMSAMEDAWG